MYIPGSLSTNTNLSTTIMNNNLHHQQQFPFENLKDHRSNKVPSTSNFSFDPDLLRELNARYLHDMNTTQTINGNGFSTHLHAKHYHQHTHTHEHNLNILTPSNNSLFSSTSLVSSPSFNLINNKKKENFSSSPKKSNKWSTAHIQICWMIYHQQQRLKDKSSSLDEQQQQLLLNNKLPDLISNTKRIYPSLSNDLSFPLSSTHQTSLLSQPEFNYRSSFDISNVNNNPYGRISLSSNSAFGGLGSLFSSIPISIDRKLDTNGSILPRNLDWSRFHCNSSINDNLSSKKFDETNNINTNESRKRSSAIINNDDDRRNSRHHLINNNYSFSNRSRSRSPHSSLSNILNKNSSSSSLSRQSNNIKSNISDNSKYSSILPTFDPLTHSIIEQKHLSKAYESNSQTNNLFPMNINSTIFHNNNSSNIFTNLDSSAMTIALLQREYFLNSLRLSQQQSEQIIERECKSIMNSNTIQINKTLKTNIEQQILSRNNQEIKRIKPKIVISPSSNSSISSNKKIKQVKREKKSPSPPPSSSIISTTQNNDLTSKVESISTTA